MPLAPSFWAKSFGMLTDRLRRELGRQRGTDRLRLALSRLRRLRAGEEGTRALQDGLRIDSRHSALGKSRRWKSWSTTLSRIEALDEGLNAVVVRDFERARAAARAADTALAAGAGGVLTGVPMTVRERSMSPACRRHGECPTGGTALSPAMPWSCNAAAGGRDHRRARRMFRPGWPIGRPSTPSTVSPATLEPEAQPRRLLGRCGGGAGRRVRPARDRLRPERLLANTGALLRRLRAPAEPRTRPHARIRTAGSAGFVRRCGAGPRRPGADGTQRRRPVHGPGRHRRTG